MQKKKHKNMRKIRSCIAWNKHEIKLSERNGLPRIIMYTKTVFLVMCSSILVNRHTSFTII